ncbi:hypothetical protein [Corynebacterium durum]|nr:hypothetical protein [Corynebacterium durum]MDO4653016.1 hypothetical protein [Corynebacterium durum]
MTRLIQPSGRCTAASFLVLGRRLLEVGLLALASPPVVPYAAQA